MLALFFLLATPVSGPSLAGPQFERFARATDRQCPARQWRVVKPADLLQAEDDYLATASPRIRAAVRTAIPRDADGVARACSNRNGASCPAVHQLDALHKVGLLGRFVTAACRHTPG